MKSDGGSPQPEGRLTILRPDPEFLQTLRTGSVEAQQLWQTVRRWPDHRERIAVLMKSNLDPAAGRGQRDLIVGLALMKPGPGGDNPRGRALWIRDFLELVRPIDPVGVIGEEWLGLVDPDSFTGPLDKVTGARLLAAIETSVAEDLKAVDALAGLKHRVTFGEDRSARGQIWRSERDAIILFSKASGIERKIIDSTLKYRSTSPEFHLFTQMISSSSKPHQYAARIDYVVDNIINDLDVEVQALSVLFGGGTSSTALAILAGTNVAHDVRKSPGLDAVYYHVESGTLAFVPYLKQSASGRVYPGDGRSAAELQVRMTELDDRIKTLQPHGGSPTAARSFITAPSFIRTILEGPFEEHVTTPLGGGIYPFAHLSQAMIETDPMDDPSFAVNQEPRYLTTTTAMSLLRDGWIGAPQVGLGIIPRLAQESLDTVGTVVVALDFSLRHRGNGAPM